MGQAHGAPELIMDRRARSFQGERVRRPQAPAGIMIPALGDSGDGDGCGMASGQAGRARDASGHWSALGRTGQPGRSESESMPAAGRKKLRVALRRGISGLTHAVLDADAVARP